jgi:hypothetical protein
MAFARQAGVSGGKRNTVSILVSEFLEIQGVSSSNKLLFAG